LLSRHFWISPDSAKARHRVSGLALALPGILVLVFFLIIPFISLAFLSLASRGQFGDVNWSPTLENYRRLLGFGLYGWSPDYLFILLRSLREALVTTVACVLLSYPLCFYIASRKTAFSRFVWLVLITVPFCTNVVIRTYAWQLVLNPKMIFAKLASLAGLIPEGAPLYPGALAVFLGMVATFLPFMALPLYAAIERLNWALPEAAKDLYASRLRIFQKAILPQTIYGLQAGVVITFVPAMAMFVVTDILGGAKYMLIGNLIQLQFSQTRDWPFGAALSLALMLLTLLSFLFFRVSRFSRKAA
jgi:spermidine/putrescine transport system permease protein